jgi:hypothetical protein
VYELHWMTFPSISVHRNTAPGTTLQ